MVDRAASAGVGRVMTVADDLAAAQWAAQAATWDPRVFAAVAVHPTRTAAFTDADRAVVEELARQPRVVAVGETGLDYYWDYSPPAAQQEAFRWHIDLAKRVGKPLMIHDRDAHEDIYRILAEEGPPVDGGVPLLLRRRGLRPAMCRRGVRAVVRRNGDFSQRARPA